MLRVPPEILSFKHINNVVQLAEPENDGGTGSGRNPLSAHSMLKYIQSAITSHQKLQIRRLERNELIEDFIQIGLALVSFLLPFVSIKLLFLFWRLFLFLLQSIPSALELK